MPRPLEHHPFGRTGLHVPKIVFGATCLGNLFVAPSDQAKRQLIAEWFAQVSPPVVIDTAGKYGAGLALEVIGRELSEASIAPDDVVISNKLGWRRVPLMGAEPTFEPGVWVDLQHDAVQDISHQGILRCWEEAQVMLQGYPQQLVSVHDPDEYLAAAVDLEDRERRMADVRGAYQALEELRDRGLARGVGVGAKDWRVIRELDRHCDLDWVMLANSFTIMHHPPELIAFVESLAQRGIAVINSALTHGGFLTGGRFLDYHEVDPTRAADAHALSWRERYHDVCHTLGVSPYDVAIAFGAAHPAVTTVAVSTSRPDRVESMVRAVCEPTPEGVWSALREAGLIAPSFLPA